jgi:hypothetical protein
MRPAASRPEAALRGLTKSAPSIATPLRIRAGDTELGFISTLPRFGTAVDVTVSEPSIESFFPIDDVTTEFVRAAVER